MLLATLRPDRLVAIGWWRLIGKRLRAHYRLRDAIARLPFAYERRLEAQGQADLAVARCGTPPGFCVHIHLRAGKAESALRAIASALRQSHPATVLITHDGSGIKPPCLIGAEVLGPPCETAVQGLHLALQEARKRGLDYCIPMCADLELWPHAVAALAAQMSQPTDWPDHLPVLYGDQDEAKRSALGFQRGVNPWLKPAWDPRMILSQDYVSSACALPIAQSLSLLDAAGDDMPESRFELLLRLTKGSSAVRVQQVRRTLVQTRPGDWCAHGPATVRAVARVVADAAQVSPGPFGTTQLQWAEPKDLPTISVVVATRDKVELLRTCVDGLLHGTDYPALEVIIADNGSREPETLAYMDEAAANPRVRVVRWPHPFNYSAINNFAASQATGEYLCLLNNDIEILHPDWLRAMLREAVQPGVGAVGARLLYPDRSIQHAGVVIGVGNAAGHAHRALPDGEPGYFAQAHIARGASAVTAACLLLRKRDFDAVGGLDEEHLAVAYNDVDLCLKLGKSGLANIYTPAATLVHHESKSRGLDFSPEHVERYKRELDFLQRRWETDKITDPWHHPQLNRASEIFVADHIP